MWHNLPLDIIRKIVLLVDDIDVRIAFGNIGRLDPPRLRLRFPKQQKLYVKGGDYKFEWTQDGTFQFWKNVNGFLYLSGCTCDQCIQ